MGAILLATTTALLKVTAGTGATNVDIQANWVDLDQSTTPPAIVGSGPQNTNIATPSTVTAVSSPGTSTIRRNIEDVTITNNNTTTSVPITVLHLDVTAGTTVTKIGPIQLAPGATIVYSDGCGWQVLQGGTLQNGALGLNAVTRANLGTDGKNWSFLGQAILAVNAVTIGPIIWVPTFQQIELWYIIKGYNGGTPVGRCLVGATSISTTAANNSWSGREGVTAPTTEVSIPGCPLAVTLSAIGRQGRVNIDGGSGSLKTLRVDGGEGTPAVTTAPVIFDALSNFSDLGTNLPLQRAQLTVYDTLIATAQSTNLFTTGSYLIAWGRNND